MRGSYTGSRYYGNFDQDNSTVDARTTPTSSSARRTSATAPGRQLWDNRLGTLRGDRPHAFKIYGSYFLPWHASVGAYVVAQSGQPWEKWELRALQRVHDVDERHDQVRRAGGLAPRAVARAARPEVHRRTSRSASATARRSTSTCSTCSTSRRATTSSRASTLAGFGTAAELLRSAARADRVQVHFLTLSVGGSQLPACRLASCVAGYRQLSCLL